MAEKIPSKDTSAEELQLEILRFESRTGGGLDSDGDFELGPRVGQPAPEHQTGGYVVYERDEDGRWMAIFHDPQEQG